MNINEIKITRRRHLFFFHLTIFTLTNNINVVIIQIDRIFLFCYQLYQIIAWLLFLCHPIEEDKMKKKCSYVNTPGRKKHMSAILELSTWKSVLLCYVNIVLLILSGFLEEVCARNVRLKDVLIAAWLKAGNTGREREREISSFFSPWTRQMKGEREREKGENTHRILTKYLRSENSWRWINLDEDPMFRREYSFPNEVFKWWLANVADRDRIFHRGKPFQKNQWFLLQ